MKKLKSKKRQGLENEISICIEKYKLNDTYNVIPVDYDDKLIFEGFSDVDLSNLLESLNKEAKILDRNIDQLIDEYVDEGFSVKKVIDTLIFKHRAAFSLWEVEATKLNIDVKLLIDKKIKQNLQLKKFNRILNQF